VYKAWIDPNVTWHSRTSRFVKSKLENIFISPRVRNNAVRNHTGKISWKIMFAWMKSFTTNI